MNNKNEINNLRQKFFQEYNEKDFHSAAESLEKLIKLHGSNFNEYEYSLDLYNLGIVYQKMGRFSMANKLYLKIIKILDNSEYRDNKEIELIIDTENALGISYSKMRNANLSYSLNSFEKALKLTKQNFKDDKEKILKIMHNIGCVYHDLKRYEEAIYYHLEELSLREKKDLDYVDNLNFLGYDYEASQNYETAVGYFKQSLDILKGLEGINSEEHMNNTYYLANVYLKMEEYENAIKYLEKFCAFVEQSYGDKAAYFAECLTKLAESYVKVGKLKEALEVQLKSLKVIQNTVGEDHIYYASNIRKMGDIYYLQEEYLKALPYYEKETNLKRDIIGNQNEEYVNSILNLINVKIKAGQNDDYEYLEKEIYQLINKGFPKISYKRALLIVCKIFIENNMAERLYYVYEHYKNIYSESFDDMLKNAEEIEEDIIDKENNILKPEEDFENFDPIDDHIFDGIKNLFEGIKKEIDKYEKQYKDEEDEENQ